MSTLANLTPILNTINTINSISNPQATSSSTNSGGGLSMNGPNLFLNRLVSWIPQALSIVAPDPRLAPLSWLKLCRWAVWVAVVLKLLEISVFTLSTLNCGFADPSVYSSTNLVDYLTDYCNMLNKQFSNNVFSHFQNLLILIAAGVFLRIARIIADKLYSMQRMVERYPIETLSATHSRITVPHHEIIGSSHWRSSRRWVLGLAAANSLMVLGVGCIMVFGTAYFVEYFAPFRCDFLPALNLPSAGISGARMYSGSGTPSTTSGTSGPMQPSAVSPSTAPSTPPIFSTTGAMLINLTQYYVPVEGVNGTVAYIMRYNTFAACLPHSASTLRAMYSLNFILSCGASLLFFIFAISAYRTIHSIEIDGIIRYEERRFLGVLVDPAAAATAFAATNPQMAPPSAGIPVVGNEANINTSSSSVSSQHPRPSQSPTREIASHIRKYAEDAFERRFSTTPMMNKQHPQPITSSGISITPPLNISTIQISTPSAPPHPPVATPTVHPTPFHTHLHNRAGLADIELTPSSILNTITATSAPPSTATTTITAPTSVTTNAMRPVIAPPPPSGLSATPSAGTLSSYRLGPGLD